MRPVVAIVGRPNVGKSTFFNRMIGEREAIVHDEYGVTRDRHYGVCDWNGRTFTVIDTGGFLPDKDDEIATAVREQIQLGIQEAHVVLFLVDSVMGIQQLDDEVAKILRKSQKPVIVVSNKADNEERMLQANEFYGLGFGDLFAVSSISGLGTGDLLDRVVELLPPIDEEEEGDRLPRISFIGRPNVGKSSLVNALLKTDRCIVTDIPGTTRDSIDTQFSYDDEEYILVDTAGLRKKARVKENIEFYSTVRTEKAIRECDVAVLLIDATRGFEDQDKKVLNLAERFNKGMLIAVNKWDLIEDKETNTWKAFEQSIKQAMPQIEYVPCFSLSALTGQRVDKLMGHVIEVLEERKKQIPTKKFTEFISDVTKMRPLPMKRGRTLTIQYASQVKSNPPVFKFFMNQPQDLPANYRKFIEHQIREEYGFEGVPITMVFRQK